MVDVNRTPLNTIPHKWAFDKEIEPFIRSLLKQIDQLRARSGGDSDFTDEIQTDTTDSESNFNYDIRQLREDHNKNLAEIQTARKVRLLESQIDSMAAEIQTNRRQLSTINATLNALKAELETNG